MKITVTVKSDVYERFNESTYQFEGDMMFDTATRASQEIYEYLKWKESRHLKKELDTNEE